MGKAKDDLTLTVDGCVYELSRYSYTPEDGRSETKAVTGFR